MVDDYLKFVIVGHVDHGKSTLIGRLLFDTDSIPQEKVEEVKTVCQSLGREFEFAYLMDYLEEERQQKITIDTAQIFFKTPKRHYVIIDAPGHKEFLKNMITGATLADAAILIVDAKEGMMEQSKRHAYLLSLLGIKQLMVAINKMDLVDYQKRRFDEVKKEILAHLGQLDLKPNFVIPISARQGDFVAEKSANLSWYDGPTVLSALDSFNSPTEIAGQPLRFPIQDIYNIGGQKIIAGRVASGTLNKNQEIIVLPAGQKTNIRTILKWQEELKKAETGHSIGITITDDIDVKRGQVFCEMENQPKITDKFLATVFWLSRDTYKVGEKLVLKCVTQKIPIVIKKIHQLINSSSLKKIKNEQEINETEVAAVTIEAESKVVIENFNKLPELGRFVLVKNDDVAAGGIIN